MRFDRNTLRIAMPAGLGGSNTSRPAPTSVSPLASFGEGDGLITEDALVQVEDPDDPEA